ncbi:MAG: energy transducer TonB, partial [Sphingomicrobium sp.]
DPKRMPLTGSLQGLVRSDDYPAEALDKNEQGTVAMLLRVDRAGAVSDCIIEKSSGFAILDQRTCELMKQRAHFQPARDREGKPVASETRGSVTWQIAAMPNEPWVSRMVIAFDPSGRQVSCKMEFEGAAKLYPDMVTPSCSDGAISLPHKLQGEMPGAIATVVMEQRFVVDGSPPPSIPEGNTLISRQVLDLDVDARGKLAKCKVVERSGEAPQLDPCDDTDTDYAVRKSPDGKPVPYKATRTTTIYLRVEKVT